MSYYNPSVSVPECDSHTAIASGDFGEVVKLKKTMAYTLIDMDICKLVTDHFIAEPSHSFPGRTIGGTA